MADQRAEALETVAAAKGQVNAARKESHKTCREIARLCTAPVAGPFIFTLLWLLSVFLVTVYFGWLCWSASSAWYQPVTVFDEVLKSELEYPDIYMCLPANTIEAVEQGAAAPRPAGDYRILAGVIWDSNFYNDMSVWDADQCDYKHKHASFLEMDINKNIADCPVKSLTQSGLSVDLPRLWLGCQEGKYIGMPGEEKVGSCSLLSGEGQMLIDEHKWAKGLAELLPKNKNGISPFCLRYEMKEGAKQLYSEHGEKYLFMHHQFDPNLPDDIINVYLSKAGDAPYNEKNDITASSVPFAGGGSVTQALLRIEEVTDLTKTNTALQLLGVEEVTPTTHYRFTTWSKTSNSGDLTYAGIGILYDEFVVRKITIRFKTFAEIFAEVGGLWAGCAALLWLVWKKSGYLHKRADGSTGEEMMIINYIPVKWKDKWLNKGVEKEFAI